MSAKTQNRVLTFLSKSQEKGEKKKKFIVIIWRGHESYSMSCPMLATEVRSIIIAWHIVEWTVIIIEGR
jgi:hypothetical protein